MRNKLFVIIVLFTLAVPTFGQDTIWLPQKNYIVGEVKNMVNGVLNVETFYSDKDFAIEWLKIDSIKTKTRFLVTLSGNERYTGRVVSTGANGKAVIGKLLGSDIPINLINIVSLDGLDDDFWGRVIAKIDLSLQETKANNLVQFNLNSTLGYKADRWNLTGTIARLSSTQTNVSDIQRSDYGITFLYYPQKKWYTYSNITWFSNTEQDIDLRFSARLGIGRSLIQNNQTAWGVIVGIAPLRESFTNGNPETESTEAFIGSTWNLFDTGDLSFDGSAFAFPSLTQRGRFRTDITANVKYDLPLDFYIKLNATINYDNQAVDGNETDYVWGIGFGWKLDR
jgi:hypothetical protein